MNDADWLDVERIFAEVTALPPEAREDGARERCDGRPDLLAEVSSLLAADARAERQRPPHVELEAGDVVGAFRLTHSIAQGGMGRVFLAERVAGGFTQRAAVKLVDARGRESLRRFEAERQILAGLSHPHVVSLLDGGVTERGQPYLVMEYVDGVPLDAYCAARPLPIDERLRLCARIASAVAYAHERGVVHRDLKPANILVTADGAPKVLDFGVAKLADPAAPGLTATGLPAAMTLDYASPEQLRGLPTTIATDVFSLGIVFHEVLLGSRPYDIQGLPLDDAVRRVEAGCAELAQRAGRIEALLSRALQPAQENRLKSAGDLQRALETCAATYTGGELVAAPGRIGSRRRATMWAVSVTAAVLAAIATIVWWPVEPQPPHVDQPASSDPAVTAQTSAAPAPVAPVSSPAARVASPAAKPKAVDPWRDSSTGDLEQLARDLTDRALKSTAGEASQSLAFISEVIEVRRELVRRLPEAHVQRARLAWALSFQAQRYSQLQRTQLALDSAREGVKLTQAFAGIGGTLESDRAYVLLVQGLVQRAAGREVEACQSFAAARMHHESTRDALKDRFQARYQALESQIPAALAVCR